MSDQQYIKILGDDIPLSNDYKGIFELKFLPDNPRVYACTHGEPDFDNRTEQEQQSIIFDKLKREPSVKNLIPEVKRHGGLMEWILVRLDTMEVIEGNSRLAVYRHLHETKAPGDWDHIPCYIISKLTQEQQAAYLNQIHVKGKTKWSSYEKANFSYVRHEKGWDYDQIAKLFGESKATIRTRVKVIEMMKANGDNDQSHFSYYNVLTRQQEISAAMKQEGLNSFLLTKIKSIGSDPEDNDFTALEMRKKLPAILKKPKVLKKYLGGDITIDDAYQDAKISSAHERVKQAQQRLCDVTEKELRHLDNNAMNALEQDVRKLDREVQRINGMLKKIKGG